MSWPRRIGPKGVAVGLAGVAVAAAAIAVTLASLDDTGGAQSAGPVPDLPREAASIASGRAPADQSAAHPAAGTSTELGVFEKIRGWIVYPIGNRLVAVNPSDPSERYSLKLPAGMDVLLGGTDVGGGTDRPMPAGWSADGTKLALSSEYSSDMFVMRADGSLTRVIFAHGCCNFVVSPWLSPDGKTALLRVGREAIEYADLPATHNDRRSLDPPLPAGRAGWLSTWFADGRRIAFVSEGQSGDKPTVHIADFSSGTNRRLRGLDVGHIRHIISSPEGSELLVVAGAQLPMNALLNPLVHPQPTSLYLVSAKGSGVRKLATGYYVATAWSPDGTQIAAIEYSGIEYSGSRRLVVMDADGTGKRVLVELPADELFTGLAWHPLPDN